MDHVLVVGGGVIGAACAYSLNKAGVRVTLLDQGAFGSACSHANCGYVCPSHVLPLAAPGAAGAALKTLLQPDSPFTIRPRFDPALWNWMLRFTRRCNARDMLEAGKAIQALLVSSRSLYVELLREENIDCEWEERGLLFVFRTAAAFDHYAETDRLLTDRFGLPARRLPGQELQRLEPALLPGSAGGYLYETDAHLRPDRLMAAWKQVLLDRGVVLRENTPALDLARRRGRFVGVRTTEGLVTADACVIAAGAWSPRWKREIGVDIPIQPGKGYSITMPRPGRCPVHPLIFEEHRVAVTPFRDAYRLGSTMEFAGYDSSIDPRRLDILRKAARLYLHEPEAEPVLEEWYGWRPMTPDSVPIIGPSPRVENLWIAAGHSMLGLSMAPATGKLIAELVTGRTPHVEPHPYRPDRFR